MEKYFQSMLKDPLKKYIKVDKTVRKTKIYLQGPLFCKELLVLYDFLVLKLQNKGAPLYTILDRFIFLFWNQFWKNIFPGTYIDVIELLGNESGSVVWSTESYRKRAQVLNNILINVKLLNGLNSWSSFS